VYAIKIRKLRILGALNVVAILDVLVMNHPVTVTQGLRRRILGALNVVAILDVTVTLPHAIV